MEYAKQDTIVPRETRQLFYGEWRPTEPVIFKAEMGRQATDWLWSVMPLPLVCISQRLLDLLVENRFTGWTTYPVEVYGRQGEHLPGYHGLAIPSYAGEQSVSRSQVITKPIEWMIGPRAPLCEYYHGFYFDDSRWDGSDIFRAQHGVIVVTRMVVETFEKAGIKNVEFTPLLDIDTEVKDFERFFKGR